MLETRRPGFVVFKNLKGYTKFTREFPVLETQTVADKIDQDDVKKRSTLGYNLLLKILLSQLKKNQKDRDHGWCYGP